jgi:hypothetical protein
MCFLRGADRIVIYYLEEIACGGHSPFETATPAGQSIPRYWTSHVVQILSLQLFIYLIGPYVSLL